MRVCINEEKWLEFTSAKLTRLSQDKWERGKEKKREKETSGNLVQCRFSSSPVLQHTESFTHSPSLSLFSLVLFLSGTHELENSKTPAPSLWLEHSLETGVNVFPALFPVPVPADPSQTPPFSSTFIFPQCTHKFSILQTSSAECEKSAWSNAEKNTIHVLKKRRM